MYETQKKERVEIEKRFLQLWLQYPDTKCYVTHEDDKVIVVNVVVKKEG